LVEWILMNMSEIKQFVDLVRAHGLPERPEEDSSGLSKPWVYVSEAPPPVKWDRPSVESALGAQLPPEVVDLWAEAGGLNLYVEKNYRQWGLVVWSPTEVVAGNLRMRRVLRTSDLRHGDVIIGNFEGDTDLLLLRCDRAANDYGSVIIIDALERRKSWKVAARSLAVFLERFCEARGEKYWEVHWKERRG
jgi:hypothetical protein